MESAAEAGTGNADKTAIQRSSVGVITPLQTKLNTVCKDEEGLSARITAITLAGLPNCGRILTRNGTG